MSHILVRHHFDKSQTYINQAFLVLHRLFSEIGIYLAPESQHPSDASRQQQRAEDALSRNADGSSADSATASKSWRKTPDEARVLELPANLGEQAPVHGKR